MGWWKEASPSLLFSLPAPSLILRLQRLAAAWKYSLKAG